MPAFIFPGRRRGVTAAAEVQAPVTLAAADGEEIVLSGTSQSNFEGDGWHTDSGFTRARDWVGPNPLGGDFAGHDDVNFLAIVIWNCDFGGTGFYARMDDLGVNGMFPCAGSVSLSNNITYEKWACVYSGNTAGGTISSGDDPGVVGVLTGEEPSTVAGYEAQVDDAVTWLASSDGSGRYHEYNFADNLLNGDLEFHYFPDDMVIGRTDDRLTPDRPQYTACDQYWIAGSVGNAGGSQTKLPWRLYPQLGGGTSTTAQCARGSHYGSMLDSIRKQYPAGRRAPIGIWIENGAPYTEEDSVMISPAQLKWAVWSTFVHGARGIYYFNHTFRIDDPLQSNNNLNNDLYGGPGVTGTGIYAATKEVNWNALTVAPAINGPFDGYFVWGDEDEIETAGFLTAVTSTNARSEFGGVDACCKWVPDEEKHYILATTREVDGSTNWPVTFRMVDQGQTTAVRLFDTTGEITIERGGAIPAGFCEFDDTFATAAAYKCYRID